MKTAYYKSDKKTALSWISDWKAKKSVGDTIRDAILKNTGADRTLEQNGLITGVAFLVKSLADDPWTDLHGDRSYLKFEHLHSDGKRFACYTPKYNRILARPLQGAITQFNIEAGENPRTLSKYIVKRTETSRMVCIRRDMCERA